MRLHRRMVIGFLFSEYANRVVLIKKIFKTTSPLYFMHGKLNGVGGKVEPGETSFDAMVREFREEAGVVVKDWDFFAKIISPEDENFQIDYFRSFGNIDHVKKMEEEEIWTVPTNYLPDDVLYNVRWLIPLAMDREIETTKCKLAINHREIAKKDNSPTLAY